MTATLRVRGVLSCVPAFLGRAGLISLLWLSVVYGVQMWHVLPARAQVKDRCQIKPLCALLTTRASELVQQNRYEEAIVLYERAYLDTAEPRLLINIGRCHYRLGHPERAMEKYLAFRASNVKVDAELEERVSKFIAEARQVLDSEGIPARRAPATRTPAPAEPVELEPPPAGYSASGVAIGEQASGLAPRRPTWRKVVGALSLAAGAAQIGIGAWALSQNGACLTPSAQGGGLCQPVTGSNGQPVADVINGTGVGAALLTTGGVFVIGGVILLALPPPRSRPR